MIDAARTAERAARDAYGRLLAYLSSRTRDIAAAEDALSEAFARALARWPEEGVPANPDAWLLTVARNHITDAQRRQSRFPTTDEAPDMPDDTMQEALPDRRLALLMVCAHPSIAPELHAPLMLQTVLGLDAKAIARLFLLSPAALSKQLVRAKAKIKAAGIAFTIPDEERLPERSMAILEAVYALHAYDWLDPTDSFGEEALYLADLLGHLMPRNAEVLGLVALIALSHARTGARIVDGALVPTEEQDIALWDDTLIAAGRGLLARASALGAVGRFQIEAAIEAVHIARRETGAVDWAALNKLYHALLRIAPSAGALVAQATVTGRLHGTDAALKALDAVERQTGTGFQPLWAARAEMAALAGHRAMAARCYEKAISLTTDRPSAILLKSRLAQLGHS